LETFARSVYCHWWYRDN